MCVLELFILLFILLFKCLLLTMLKFCFGQINLSYLRPNPKFINFCLCAKSPKAERQWSIWLLSGGSHRTKCLYLLVWTLRVDCVCYHMVLFSSGANGLKAEPLFSVVIISLSALSFEFRPNRANAIHLNLSPSLCVSCWVSFPLRGVNQSSAFADLFDLEAALDLLTMRMTGKDQMYL